MMGSLNFSTAAASPISVYPIHTSPPRFSSCAPLLALPSVPRSLATCGRHRLRPLLSRSGSDDAGEVLVEALRVPDSWTVPSNALQESEWLRVSLHKWLDDEYCPEPTNVEISKVAAQSYYESLIVGRSDMRDILLNMISALESLSYQESFHGAFSSANAAVHLITLKMESL